MGKSRGLTLEWNPVARIVIIVFPDKARSLPSFHKLFALITNPVLGLTNFI
jgi:hypothetical protein